MDWNKQVTYRRWSDRDSNDDSADNEICTISSRRVKPTSGNHKPDETFTVDDVLESFGFGKFQWKMSVLTGLSWIGDSMEMMILSILGPQLHCEWNLPGYQVAFLTTVVFVGMGCGSTAIGKVSDKYGRRIGLMLCMCWCLFYGLLSAFSPAYGWLLFLRGLVGVGLGGAPQSVTLYSEFLPVKSRGICITLIAGFWALGSLLEVLLAFFIMPTLGWKWLLGLSTVPTALFLCFYCWLPESIRFNLLTGRTDKAMVTLERIAKENGKNMPKGRLVAYQQSSRGQLKDLFSPQYWRTTLLLWFIWFSNAFSYYGIVLLTTELFQAGHSCGTTAGAKLEPSCRLQCSYLTAADYRDLIWTTLAEFPGILVIIVAIERIGRKKSLALCFFMFSLCILPVYACIGRTAVTICIFVARAFISGGFQVAFVYTPEVFPTENRALAMGTSSAFSRIGALITPFVAQVLLRTSMWWTLSLYFTVCLLGGVASLVLPIETLGRNLHESSPGTDIRTDVRTEDVRTEDIRTEVRTEDVRTESRPSSCPSRR